MVFGLLFCPLARVGATEPAKPARHVVVLVWDGMRPDLVSAANTPTLFKLAGEGVVFRNHHSVYPSSTLVNGVALATGAYPEHGSVISNREYRPEINDRKPFDADNEEVIEKGDNVSGGHYVGRPTVAELLRKSGRHTAIATSKGVGLLHDRHVDGNGVDLFSGNSLPATSVASIVARLGVFPLSKILDSKADNWTTTALLKTLWKDGVPDFSLLWLAEPDGSEHKHAPGSPSAVAALRGSDNNLARVLAALDRADLRNGTDVLIVSDHGFSTIARSIDLRKILPAAGFDVATEFQSNPKPGQIMMVGNGGSVSFYLVHGGPEMRRSDDESVRRLVEFLQQTDFAGVIFSRLRLEGTFELGQGKIDSAYAPDVMMSFRWNDAPNEFGIRGMIDADWVRKAGQGTHATLSRFDMHNTFIAAGPDFRRGATDDLPTGNIDVAPTILQILGVPAPAEIDGRVLFEAMSGHTSEEPKVETTTLEAGREFPKGKWHQTLRISRVGSTTYLDEGNGGFAVPNH